MLYQLSYARGADLSGQRPGRRVIRAVARGSRRPCKIMAPEK